MTQRICFFAALALSACALCPATVLAEEGMEGLDDTMIVVDNPASIAGEIAKMRGPNDRDVDREDWEDTGPAMTEPAAEVFEDAEDSKRLKDQGDDFERDRVREEEELAEEDNFEEGEDIDLDEYDIDDDMDEDMN